MPRVPGMTVFPNSAPDSLTPKYANLVRDPEQTLSAGEGAELVVDGELGVEVELGWHCE